tara:strand:+ start:1288 stop:1656 length:369 start_codon:yes stop_codon:yes gene_type:complete
MAGRVPLQTKQLSGTPGEPGETGSTGKWLGSSIGSAIGGGPSNPAGIALGIVGGLLGIGFDYFTRKKPKAAKPPPPVRTFSQRMPSQITPGSSLSDPGGSRRMQFEPNIRLGAAKNLQSRMT